MTKTLSIVFGVLLGISIIFGGKSLYEKYQLNQAYSALNDQLMQANLDVGKARTQFGNAQDKLKELSKELKDEIKKSDELLTMYGELELKYEVAANVKPEVIFIDGPVIEVPIELDIVAGLLYEAVEPKALVRLDKLEAKHSDFRLDIDCVFSPYPNGVRDLPAEIKYRLHLRLQGQLVQSIAPSGATNHYLTIFEIDDKGNKVGELTIEKFDVIVQKPKDKSFYWWAPHLDIGLFLGASSTVSFTSGATIGMSVMGYGYTKNDLSWKFLRFGGDFSNQSIGLSFSPVAYNVSIFLPLVSNLWISPYISSTTTGNKSLGLQLTVGL